MIRLRCSLFRVFGFAMAYACTHIGNAQESPERLDSVLPLLNTSIRDTAQLDLLIMVAESWYTSDNAYPYLARMDSLSAELLKSPNADVRRRARHARGAYHYFIGYHAKFARNIPLALRSLQQALADFQVHNERHAMAETNDALGVLFRAAGHPERSIAFFQEELRLGRELRHDHVTNQALVHLAAAHIEGHRPDIAAIYLDSCGRGTPADSSAVLLERAKISTLQGKRSDAIAQLEKSLTFAGRSANPWDKLPVLSPLARSFYAIGKHEKGLAAARECVDIAERMGDQTARCACTMLIGIGELSLGRDADAERTLLEGLRLAEANHNVGAARELGDEGSMVHASKMLKDLYRKQGRLPEALAMTDLWSGLKDSVARMDGREEILLFEFQREHYTDSLANVEQVRSQQALHDRQIAAEKTRRNMFALLGILLLVVVVAFWSRARLLRRSNAAILTAQDQLLASEKALEAEAVRTRIARDIHDELGSDLTKIAMLGSEAKRRMADGSDQVAPVLDRLGRLAREAGGALKDIVWSVDPEQDTWQGLVHHARVYAQRVLDGTGVEADLQFGHSGPDAPIDPATKRNIFLVLKEALNNALKYAQASRISVHLNTSMHGFQLTVSDNGPGFDPVNASQAGNGLRNMRTRAERLRAELRIRANDPQGTRLELVSVTGP
ncbi:MAG: sensor histidine kinase [Flavobacteriales bacterium]|nr:sensor histidine kinase [Flavobacteriales bacterium]